MHDVGESWLMVSLTASPILIALVETAGRLPMALLAAVHCRTKTECKSLLEDLRLNEMRILAEPGLTHFQSRKQDRLLPVGIFIVHFSPQTKVIAWSSLTVESCVPASPRSADKRQGEANHKLLFLLKEKSRSRISREGPREHCFWVVAENFILTSQGCEVIRCARYEESRRTRTNVFRTRHSDGFHTAGLVSASARIESIAGRQSVRAHGVEDSRWLYKRPDHFNCSNARWLSLAWYGVRFATLRRCSERPLAAADGSAALIQFHLQPAGLARRDSLDWHIEGPRKLEGRQAHSVPRARRQRCLQSIRGSRGNDVDCRTRGYRWKALCDPEWQRSMLRR